MAFPVAWRDEAEQRFQPGAGAAAHRADSRSRPHKCTALPVLTEAAADARVRPAVPPSAWPRVSPFLRLSLGASPLRQPSSKIPGPDRSVTRSAHSAGSPRLGLAPAVGDDARDETRQPHA